MYYPLLFITSLLMIPSSHGLTVTNTTVPDCPSFDCGNGLRVEYPFWVSDDESAAPPMYCGYSNMMLHCRNNTPVLRIADDDYALQRIDYPIRTLHVANIDLLLDTGKCPSGLHNFTLAAQYLFEYTAADSNLTLYLDCNEGPPGDGIECVGDGGNRSFVFLEGEIPSGYNWSRNCGETVMVPVLWELVQMVNVSALQEMVHVIVQSGFQLSWVPGGGEGCPACEDSGGRCGYNQNSSGGWEFLCFCQDGMHEFQCNGGSDGKRNSNTIIIGVASGGAGLLAACCLFLAVYIQKGRKRRSSASSLLLRAICSPLPFKKDPESGSGFYPTQNFSYRELEAATDGFSSSKELGDGGFGTVYKGKLRDGRTVAVKRLYENNYKRVEQFMNEITILSRLHHQNLVSLYGCSSRHSRELLLVYEFVPNGTLADHLHGSRASNGTLTWHVRLNIAIETADALAYLHAVEPPIIHRDVKTNNILLDNGFHVKVADFGLSRLFPADATHVSTAPQGTPGYVDPEYHQCYQLTDKSDVYSFGVVLVELMSSKPAVDVNRHRHEINLANMAVNKMQNNELHELIDPQLGYQSDSEVKNMIERTAELAFRCLNGGGDMRPPIKEVLEVLQVIKKGGNKEEKATERNASSRYGTPMTSGNPCSWDSVSDKSPSRSSTPSTSG